MIMDYEKKYKEAIERAKEIIECSKSDTKEVRMVLSFFPELADSKDEKVKKSLIRLVKSFYDVNFPTPEGFTKEQLLSWLEKQGEQKPAEWSKEDERNFDIIYGIIYNSCIAEDASRLIEWLKSLKDRVQPQPQQQWSEEDDDDAWLNDIICKVESGCQLNKDEINWLKSLRPQSQWKPSKEQMDGLKEAIEFLGCTKTRREQLQSLYEQLKKLREE